MSRLTLSLLFCLVIVMSSCTSEDDPTIPMTIDKVTITAIRSDDSQPLTDADVSLFGHNDTYVGGKTNTSGVVIFYEVQANYHNMHCHIEGVNNSMPYVWRSEEEGYPSGINFYDDPSMTIRIDPLF